MAPIRLFQELDMIRGRGNSLVTMFIPPDLSIMKELELLKKRFNMIKRIDKKWQILQVLELIIRNPSTGDLDPYEDYGKIICAGFSKEGHPIYFDLYPPNKIEKFEYYYDFFFYMDKVREIWYKQIIYVPEGETKIAMINKLEETIEKYQNEVLIGHKRLEGALMMGIIKELYRFTEKDLDDYTIEKLKRTGAMIIKVPDEEMHKKYGPEVGISWFIKEE